MERVQQVVRQVEPHDSVERYTGLGVEVIEGEVVGLVTGDAAVTGVRLADGQVLRARTTILTTGTFLGGKIHIGEEQVPGGRAGDPPSNALARRLRELPFRVERLKTGTPPRIDGNCASTERRCEMMSWCGEKLSQGNVSHSTKCRTGSSPPPKNRISASS